jgi:CheY-like chemotaxis protein
MALRAPPQSYILVVDDFPALSSLLAEILRIAGYRSVTAANGQEALSHLTSDEPPALILLDLRMPGMSGWEFRAEQQRDPLLNKIPVVILSSEDDLPQQAALLQVAGYLPKPAPIRDLLAIVRRLVPPVQQPAAVR